MEIGVLLVALALVLVTSVVISVLGVGFWSLLGISMALGGVLYCVSNTGNEFETPAKEKRSRPAPAPLP